MHTAHTKHTQIRFTNHIISGTSSFGATEYLFYAYGITNFFPDKLFVGIASFQNLNRKYIIIFGYSRS